MFKDNKTIQVIGYTPESVKKIGVRLIENGEAEVVAFSARKLIIALARTILAMQPHNPQLVYQAISSYSALYPLISDSEEFGFVEDANVLVRDYLLSTRTGELAPAMGYLFAQEQLQKPFVVDFSAILTDPLIQVYPDLAATDLSGAVSFIESKGSRDIRNKGKLREALLQSENATIASDIVASDFYALFISVTKSDKEVSSAIHYTFTESLEQSDPQDVKRLIFQHYATWFQLLGYTKEAEKLAAGKAIKLKKLKKFVRIKKEKYYVLDASNSLFFNVIRCWDNQFDTALFAISEDVLCYLQGGEEPTLPTVKHVQKVTTKHDLFADGTVLIYNE